MLPSFLKGLWLKVLTGVKPEANNSWHFSWHIIIPGDHLNFKGSNLKCFLKHFKLHSAFSFANFSFQQSLAVTQSWQSRDSTLWDRLPREEGKSAHSQTHVFAQVKESKPWPIRGHIAAISSLSTKIHEAKSSTWSVPQDRDGFLQLARRKPSQCLTRCASLGFGELHTLLQPLFASCTKWAEEKEWFGFISPPKEQTSYLAMPQAHLWAYSIIMPHPARSRRKIQGQMEKDSIQGMKKKASGKWF